jgi:hypothetical protein
MKYYKKVIFATLPEYQLLTFLDPRLAGAIC